MHHALVVQNVVAERPSTHPEIQAFAERARDYATLARSESTRRSYAGAMHAFTRFCEARGACALPASAEALLSYLIDAAGRLKVSTLRRHLVAIREAHADAGHRLDTSGPFFRDAWSGIQRAHGQPAAKKRPLMTVDLRRALEALPSTLAGKRDRALILVGFAAALRRSELAALEVRPHDGAGWIEEKDDGLVIHLGRTKTDQQGHGAEVGVPYGSNPTTCPVRNYRAWIRAARIRSGPAFRAVNRHGQVGEEALTGRAVARIVKRAVIAQALAEGDTPAQAKRRAAAYAGHSLRSGLATSAAAHDAPGHSIQRQLRHKRFDTTSGYIRTGQLFRQNAATLSGL